ncbi:MAG: TrpB-like pyridoxal phosphate-dependent enzyme, partial [Anaerovorax sp.]
GGHVMASPSDTTNAGRQILAEDPENSGSLGCAISEAVEKAVTTENCKYVLGSVLNQVLLHQSIIGLESKKAMDLLGEYPDVIVGCAGGGSNLGGLIAPFMQDKILGKKNPRMVAVEPTSCPSLTRGVYAYDFCDTGKITPMAKMYTLGCTFKPSSNHAGGLRYHGMSPIISKLYHDGYMEAISVGQTKVFESAVLFAKNETILPAPESAHAIYGAIQEALKCKETGEEKTILFGLTGTGFFDMTAYQAFNAGKMEDYIPSEEDLKKGFDELPHVKGVKQQIK